MRTQTRELPSAPRWPHAPGLLLLGASIGVFGAIVSCVFDENDVCGPNQRLVAAQQCVCVEGTVRRGGECVPCGDNEVVSGGACVCVEGYTRPSAGEACVPVVAGLGDACDTTLAPCAGTYSYCHVTESTSGYCTATGCTSTEECEQGYACERDTSPSYCRRPPIGLGAPCESNAECAGTEATLCDTRFTKTCMVQGCSLSPDDCFEGWSCCDLTALGVGTVCVPEGECPL